MPDKFVRVKLHSSTWRKLLACIHSKDTSIDTLGDCEYVYAENPNGTFKKDIDDKKVKLTDKKTNKPLTVKVDYDPTVNFWRGIAEIEFQLSQTGEYYEQTKTERGDELKRSREGNGRSEKHNADTGVDSDGTRGNRIADSDSEKVSEKRFKISD